MIAKRTLRAVLVAGVVVAGVVRQPAPAHAATYCGAAEMEGYLATLAASLGIRPPVVLVDPGLTQGAVYTTNTNPPRITVREDCKKATVLAHEFGHYVTDVAAGFSWERFQAISARFTAFPNWLKQSDDLEGYERTAHCIGNRWVPDGGYTRCPHEGARAIAAELVQAAAVMSRPAPPTDLQASLDGDNLVLEWRPSASVLSSTGQQLYRDGLVVAELGPSTGSVRVPRPSGSARFQLRVLSAYSSNLSDVVVVDPDGGVRIEAYTPPPVLLLDPPTPPPPAPPPTPPTPPVSAPPTTAAAPETAAPAAEPVTPVVLPEPEWIDMPLFPELDSTVES